MYKLDVKDKKLLFELDFNARLPNSQLAKKIGLSKQGVDYKINNLIKNNVITGFYPVINVTKLGYIYSRILLKFQNLTYEKEQEIFKQFKANKKFNWIIKSEGNYDLVMAIWTKTLKEFKLISEELIEKYGYYIKEKKESIAIRVTHFQNRFLLDKKATKEIALEEETEKVKIDDIDREILKILCANARISLAEISKKIKVSSKVIAYRIKRLEKQKIILGYRPNINHNLLGFTHYKILFYLSNVNKEELMKLKEFFRTNPKVIYTVEEIGVCDVDIELMMKSSQDFFEFLREVKYAFPSLIKEYATLIIDETLKINYLPFD